MAYTTYFNNPQETDTIKGSADVIRNNINALLVDKFTYGTGAPTVSNDYYLYFNTTTKEFLQYVSGVWTPIIKLAIANLSDVTLTSLTANQILYWDGTQWLNGDVTDGIDLAKFKTFLKNNIELGDFKGVTISNANEDDLLQYTGGQWKNKAIADLGFSLKSLSDVSITSPQDKEILEYDSTALKWKNVTHTDLDTKNTAGAKISNDKFYPVGVKSADVDSDYGVTVLSDNFYVDGGTVHLGSNTVGSDTQPVYINTGVPTAISNPIKYYTAGTGIDISTSDVISNTGVTDGILTVTDLSDTTATGNSTLDITKNGTTTQSKVYACYAP